MSPFFGLPADIRRICLEYALFSSRRAPEYPTKDNRAKFEDMGYTSWRAWAYHELNGSSSSSTYTSSPNCLALLLTSREMNAETRAILALNSSARSRSMYHLDISVLNDNDVFPTWLCVPQLTTHVQTLYADVRLFGTIIEPSVSRKLVGCGGHARYEWDFLALLERFLQYGPVGQKQKKESKPGSPLSHDAIIDRQIQLDTLILDFSSAEEKKAQRAGFPPPNVGYGYWNSYRSGLGHRRRRGKLQLEKYNTRPEWLAEMLADEIDLLLNFGFDRERFAKILYARIRVIRMLVDGQLFREINVAERLDEYKYTDKRKDAPDWVMDLETPWGTGQSQQ
ncbi:hypothetical protein BJY01DRAFT_258601 [Aspergillus pseudoustus]|uniref:Uncharacterized protein n=1 Tax=Aspergillus pseudoustus TaxID=1810923 RepID=A0ABR4J9N4_9EURO